jgi:hypothetical protein
MPGEALRNEALGFGPARPPTRSVGLPVIGLFADQEIKMIRGPLFVGHPYKLEREIAALWESRRIESCWVRTRILDGETDELVTEMLPNHASLKDSYAGYADERRAD